MDPTRPAGGGSGAPEPPPRSLPPIPPALVFLVRRSLRNRVVHGLRRMKSPRYLVPVLLGMAYFGVLIAGQWMGRGGTPAPPASTPGGGAVLRWGVTAGLLAMAFSSWVLPTRGAPIPFLESEVAMLFPAPLSRRHLVRYKLLAMQVPLFVSCLFLTLFLGGSRGVARIPYVFVGGWLVLNILSLHGIAVQFHRTALLTQGRSGLRRAAPALLLLAGGVAAMALLAPPFPWDAWFGEGRVGHARLLREWFVELEASPLALLLAPVRVLALLPFSETPLEFLARAAATLGIAAILLRLVERTDVAFEEAAAEHAAQTARQLAVLRRGHMGVAAGRGRRSVRTPWRLSPAGSAEGAFIWKGFMAFFRNLSPRFLLVLGILATAGLGWMQSAVSSRGGGPQPVATMLLATVAAVLCAWGPALVGAGFRQDMEMLEFLKSVPVAPTRLFRAEVLGGAAPVVALQAALLVLAWLFFPAGALDLPRAGAWGLAGLASLLLLLPTLTLVVFTLDAALVVLFPAWARPRSSEEHPGGMEAVGTGMMIVLSRALGIAAFSLLPGALGGVVAVASFALAPPVFHPVAATFASTVATAALLAELHFASAVLGERFHRMDPSKEGLVR